MDVLQQVWYRHIGNAWVGTAWFNEEATIYY